MCQRQVLVDPRNYVIFEGSLNDLMKQIWRQQFMYVCTREILGEWLVQNQNQPRLGQHRQPTTHLNIPANTELLPQDTGIEALNKELGLLV